MARFRAFTCVGGTASAEKETVALPFASKRMTAADLPRTEMLMGSCGTADVVGSSTPRSMSMTVFDVRSGPKA